MRELTEEEIKQMGVITTQYSMSTARSAVRGTRQIRAPTEKALKITVK